MATDQKHLGYLYKLPIPGLNSRPAEAQSAFFFPPTSLPGDLWTYKNLRTTVPRPSFFPVPIKVVIPAIKDRTSINGKARQVIQTKKGKLASCHSTPSLSRCQILTRDHNSLGWKMSFSFTNETKNVISQKKLLFPVESH